MEENKKRSFPFIWVLLVLIIVLGYIAYRQFTTVDEDKVTKTEIIREKNLAVTDYINFLSSGKEMGLNHEFTNEAFRRLIAALTSKAAEVNFSIAADLDKVKEHAEHITKDPFETTHANSIRKAADILSGLMKNLQTSKYPALSNNVMEVEKAASSINPSILTLDQQTQVKSFFETSGNLLQKMQ